ncbi:MAG: DUF1054 domain-containing protein [Lactobacillales bacterium]|jgi:uncharacterized protein YktB (UPF0637 family)|nr:DUF1054 domain-containing protein [Lactobacillales bacterium]
MKMFKDSDFDIFKVEGLEPRMVEIRAHIQPIFQELDDYFAEKIQAEIGEATFVHIAQHRRRTAYAPENTWSAISLQKRGYKMEPHFQLGIWGEYVFMYLSVIDQPKGKVAIAESWLAHLDDFSKLSTDFVFSKDHTVPDYFPATSEEVEKALTRLRDVKKGEFEIGRVIPRGAEIFQTPEKARNFMWETYKQLLSIYNLGLIAQKEELLDN